MQFFLARCFSQNPPNLQNIWYKIMGNYIYLIIAFCWSLINIELQTHAIRNTSRFITGCATACQGLPFCATRIDFVPFHILSLRPPLLLSFHVNLDLQTGLLPSDFRPTLYLHFLVCPFVLRAPPKTFNATNCCQNNLRGNRKHKTICPVHVVLICR